MKKITIVINTEGAAFDGYLEAETARILGKLADNIEAGNKPRKIMDINGNGACIITYEE